MISLREDPAPLTCSRAGCDEEALWQVRWRNPKIHSEDRVKIWLACADHRDYLREFLEVRNFAVSVVEIEAREGDE